MVAACVRNQVGNESVMMLISSKSSDCHQLQGALTSMVESEPFA